MIAWRAKIMGQLRWGKSASQLIGPREGEGGIQAES